MEAGVEAMEGKKRVVMAWLDGNRNDANEFGERYVRVLCDLISEDGQCNTNWLGKIRTGRLQLVFLLLHTDELVSQELEFFSETV